MAETERSKSELLTIFADGQPEGSITPTDMRDQVVSLAPAVAGMHINTAQETVIDTVDVPVKAAMLTGTSSFLSNFTHDNNKLTYVGGQPRFCYMSANMSLVSAANNQTLGLHFAFNGVSNDEFFEKSEQQVRIGGADVVNVGIQAHTSFSTNDFVEIFLVNLTSNGNFTIMTLNMTILGLIE